MTVHHKLLRLDAASIKADDGDHHKFQGYASVFNGIDSYGDRIAPGAYAVTLKNRDRPVQLRWNHWGPVIGKWIVIEEDKTGLWVEGELTRGHSKADDAAALIRHGAISGLSIGYRVKSWEEHEDYNLLKEIELVEISVVEEPADNAARISDIKGAAYVASELKHFEAILREAGGFSNGEATAVVSGIVKLARGERGAKQATDEKAATALQSLIAGL